MGRCFWWATNGARLTFSPSSFIDDISLLIAHAELYLFEGLATYLQALRQAMLKLGLSRKLYLDNGPAFRSHHQEEITVSLGIALVNSLPYVPQGRSKIERLFRTVRSQFLPGFKGDTLRDINEALESVLSKAGVSAKNDLIKTVSYL
ncbi:transposase [Desulfarculales bacterium]